MSLFTFNTFQESKNSILRLSQNNDKNLNECVSNPDCSENIFKAIKQLTESVENASVQVESSRFVDNIRNQVVQDYSEKFIKEYLLDPINQCLLQKKYDDNINNNTVE